MGKLEDAFAGIGATADLGASDEVSTAVETKATNESKDSDKLMIEAFEKAMSTDPSMMAKICTRSEDVVVLNTLASNAVNGLIPGPNKTKEKSEVLTVSGIVGALLQNVGKEPITYVTEEYALDKETGRWVGKQVKATAAPGEKFMLRIKYLTLLAMAVEYSFTFKNAKLVGGKKAMKKSSIDEILEAPHIQFNRVEGQPPISVHGDGVKIEIDDKNKKMKKEYEKTFGYLYNPEEKKENKARAKKNKFSQQILTANYIREMVAKSSQA